MISQNTTVSPAKVKSFSRIDRLSTKSEKFSFLLFSVILSIHAIAALGLFYISWTGVLSWLVAHFFFSTFGVTLGYHRYFSHKSFEAKPYFRKFLGVVSTLCLQGSPNYWAATHRVHHLFTDQKGDAHSSKRGFFWSHILWLFYLSPNRFSFTKAKVFIKDLQRDEFLNFLHRHYLLINIVTAISGFAFLYWIGRPHLFYWIFPIRIVSVWHSTWIINSFSHSAKFFKRESGDLRRSFFVAFILGGDGDHKAHHDNPTRISSAKKVHRTIDIGYQILRFLEMLSIVKIRKKTS